MKIYKKICLFSISILLLISFSFAGNLTSSNKARIDSIMVVVERDWGKEPIFTQISKYEKFIKAF